MTGLPRPILTGLLLLSGLLPTALAGPVLFDYGLNLSGSIYTFAGPSLPANVDTSGFDFDTGLGTILVDFDPGVAGNYFVDTYIEDDLSALFGNEQGSVSGTPATGQTWEISTPGAGLMSGDGNVIDAFGSDSFNDTNLSTSNPPFDVALGMGFHFSLGANDTAVVAFTVSETAPAGFYLRQFDADDPSNQIFFDGDVSITTAQSSIPEPVSLLLTLSGLLTLAGIVSVRTLRA